MTGVAEWVARALAARPVRTSRGWLVPCPVHDDRDPSLSLADGEGGRLLVRCFGGCDSRDVLAELRRRGLLEADDRHPREAPAARPAAKPKPRAAPSVYWHTRDAPPETQHACEIWRQACGPFGADAPAGRYLIGRGIPPPWPETLATGRLEHPETHERVSALIVARQCPVVGMVRGIQRIFLTDDGDKYPRDTVKMSLGSIAGGRAELIYPADELLVLEGVESALSAWRLFRTPAWAICGGFPAEMSLPARVRKVTIVADHDQRGTSERRAKALASSIRSGGRSCTVVMPDAVGADANDVIRGRVA